MLIPIAFLLATLAAGHCCVLPHHNTSCPDFSRPAVEVPDVQTMEDVRTSVKLHNMSDRTYVPYFFLSTCHVLIHRARW